MAKRGRPKLPDNERRDIPRIFLFNEHEDQKLKELAEEHDVSLATIVRWAVLTNHQLFSEGYSELLPEHCK